MFLNRRPRVPYEQIDIKPGDRCLCIAPHSDDESIGCGGLLLSYPEQFEVVVLTDGSLGGVGTREEITERRRIELNNAMEYAGIKKYSNLMVPDREMRYNLNILKKLKLSSYDYVFVPNKYETHVDHYCIYKKVREILRWAYRTKVVQYEVWATQPRPTLYYDISLLAEKKRAFIEKYESQVKANNYSEKALALNCYRGLKAGKKYVEAYTYEKSFLQRLFPIFSFSREENKVIIFLLGQRISLHF